MKVLVCGGRDYSDSGHVNYTLNSIHAQTPITEVIQGGANGADAIAARWAHKNGVKCRKDFCANWEAHGRAAGPIRNKRMLTEGNPEMVVAFDGGAGTRNMVGQAKDAGTKIVDASHDGRWS